MPTIQSTSKGNLLLQALPGNDRRRFLESGELVSLVQSEMLANPGERIRYVYFPSASFISLAAAIDGEPKLEVGLIGNEGMLGISLLLDVEISPLYALVQGAGPALRVESVAFRQALAWSPALRKVLNRYLYVSMTQYAQMAACTRFHVVESRLARWLLMTGDRAHSDAFRVTHEFLAFMLGVRRAGVTRAAMALKKRELISYHRGRLTILDRPGLEAASCDCYALDKVAYSTTMGE